MLLEACLVTMIAVSCVNEQDDLSTCPFDDKEKASAVVEEFQKRTTLKILAGDVILNTKGQLLYRGVWEDTKGVQAVIQYVPEEEACKGNTREEYIEQRRKEQGSGRWI